MRNIILASATVLSLAACSSTQTALNAPVPAAIVQDAQTALVSYQVALGLAQVALVNQPSLQTKVTSLASQAAPYVAAVQAGVTDAASAASLRALTADLLDATAAYVRIVPAAT